MELNFQFAHHSHDESESKKDVTARQALDAFDQFDWVGEIAKAEEIQKCSPTVAVLVNGKDEMVWVSGYGDLSAPMFASECCFQGEVRKWFGLSKGQGTVSLATQAFTKEQARKAIELLIAKDYQALRELYA